MASSASSRTSSSPTMRDAIIAFKTLIDQNNENDAFELLKKHLASSSREFPIHLQSDAYLFVCKNDGQINQVICLFLDALNASYGVVLLKRFDTDEKLSAFVTNNFADLSFDAICALLKACQTDETRLAIARQFVGKYDTREKSENRIGSGIQDMLEYFNDDTNRLECVKMYLDKITWCYYIYALYFNTPEGRLSYARLVKNKFHFRSSDDQHEYLNLLGELQEEQRFAFVKECLDIITPALLPFVIKKLTDPAHRAEVAMGFPFRLRKQLDETFVLTDDCESALKAILLDLVQKDKLALISKHADYLNAPQLSRTIVAAFNTDEGRLQAMRACKNMSAYPFYDLIEDLRSPVYRLRYALEMKKEPHLADDIRLTLSFLFPGALGVENPQRFRQLAETEEMKAFIKEVGLAAVVELIAREVRIQNRNPGSLEAEKIELHRIKFLKVFSPEFLLEFIDSRESWNRLQALCGNRDSLAECFGLRADQSYEDQIDFHLAMKKLTSVCSDTQHPEFLRTAGMEVARAFNEAHQSGTLSQKELSDLKAVGAWVADVVSPQSNLLIELQVLSLSPKGLESFPKSDPSYKMSILEYELFDKKTYHLRGEERPYRIAIGALAAFICAALVAASITLALVSFGVLAPLTIATITLSANMLIAGLATVAAPVALGLGTGATLFAISGRTQGPVLAVEQFIKQQPKMAQP